MQEKDGFRFIAGPNIGYGLEAGGPAHALCDTLGLSAADRTSGSRYQVALPDRRVTISPDVQETLTELRREFPREIDKITQLYRETKKMSIKASKSGLSSFFLGRRTADAYLRTRGLSRELTAYFDIQSRFFFGQDIQTLSLSSLVQLLTDSPQSFPTGLGAVSDRLIAHIEGHRGSIRLREPWPELVFHRRRISGMRTSQGSIEPRSVVVNTVWDAWECSIFIAVQSEAVPVGMECTVLSLPDYKKLDEMICFTLSRSDAFNASRDMRTLTATYFGSALSSALPEARTDCIRTIMPFLFDFTLMTFELGEGAGRYALPKEIVVSSFDPQNAMKLFVPNSMKNLYLLPDSSRALHHSLSAGSSISNRLR